MRILIFYISFLGLLIFSCTDKPTMENSPEYNNSLLEQLPHHIKLTWASDPANSQAVSWRTRSYQAKSQLEYTKATASPFFEADIVTLPAVSDTFTAEDGTWNYHTVNIQNLEPNTRYSYRVGNGDYWSEWAEFTTATGKNEPFKFLYFGDVQRFIFSKGSRAIRQAILHNPDAKFMVFAGDLIHRSAVNAENWAEFFPAGGWVFENYPTIATPGNHEHKWYPDDKTTYEEITPIWNHSFAFPKNGPEGMDEQTYFIDYNNIRVISLNLVFYAKHKEAILQWTEDRLKEFKGDWVIMTHHYHMEAAARNRNPGIRYPELKALYEKYQVPLVLTGHEHLYARGQMDGVFPVYAISVAGPWMNAIRFQDWMDRAGTSLQLFQEISVEPNQIHFVARTIMGEVYDEFWINKSSEGKMKVENNPNLGPESLEPPLNFEERYDKELVDSYEEDKAAFLNRNK